MKKIIVVSLALLLLLSASGCSFFDKEVEIFVLLDRDLTDAEAQAVATKIRTFPSAIGVEYVTAEEAFSDFAEELEDSQIFEGLDTDLLGDRCIVTAKKTDSEQLMRELLALEGVNEVSIIKNSVLPEIITDIMY